MPQEILIIFNWLPRSLLKEIEDTDKNLVNLTIKAVINSYLVCQFRHWGELPVPIDDDSAAIKCVLF